MFFFFFSSRRRHTRSLRDWSSDVCSSDLTRHIRMYAALPPSILSSVPVFPWEMVRRHLTEDRKSTRLNSSHVEISYAVFCLKKKKKKYITHIIKKKKKKTNKK